MPYDEQTWIDGAGGATPLSAARLNHIEAGIAAAMTEAEGAGGAEVPWRSPEDFGAPHDGSSSDTTGIQSVFAWARDNKGEVRFLSGPQYVLTDTVDWRFSTWVRGSPLASTDSPVQVSWDGPNDRPMFRCQDETGMSMRRRMTDLVLRTRGSDLADAQRPTYCVEALDRLDNGSIFDNVWFQHAKNSGFRAAQGGINPVFAYCRFDHNNIAGIEWVLSGFDDLTLLVGTLDNQVSNGEFGGVLLDVDASAAAGSGHFLHLVTLSGKYEVNKGLGGTRAGVVTVHKPGDVPIDQIFSWTSLGGQGIKPSSSGIEFDALYIDPPDMWQSAVSLGQAMLFDHLAPASLHTTTGGGTRAATLVQAIALMSPWSGMGNPAYQQLAGEFMGQVHQFGAPFFHNGYKTGQRHIGASITPTDWTRPVTLDVGESIIPSVPSSGDVTEYMVRVEGTMGANTGWGTVSSGGASGQNKFIASAIPANLPPRAWILPPGGGQFRNRIVSVNRATNEIELAANLNVAAPGGGAITYSPPTFVTLAHPIT